MLKILILCTGNSCRSIMAEALFNYHGHDHVIAFSAGSFPTGKVHPMSLTILKDHHMPYQGYRSKSWDEFKNQSIDTVITVCDNAAGEACPIFLGGVMKAHWGVSDPAQFQGTSAEIKTEFNRVFSLLEKRVKAFLRLPLDTINKDELQQKLNEIGAL